MKFSRFILPAAIAMAVASASPALAQRRHPGGGDGGGRSQGAGRSHDGGGSRGSGVSRQSYSRPNVVRPSGPSRGGYAVPRPSAPGRSYARPYYNRPSYNRPSYGRPSYNRPGYGYGYGYSRPVYSRPYYARPYYSRPYYGRPYYGGSYYGRPYYTHYGLRLPYLFRPRFSLSVGFFAGYPVPYSWSYPAYAPAYGYGPATAVVPGPSTYGGVTFDVTPQDAEVYVDGAFAGTTTQFDGTQQPMSLAAGQHTIELRAPGCLPLVFSVNVVPGSVIPYQGDLTPQP